jgi:hypothetical protein
VFPSVSSGICLYSTMLTLVIDSRHSFYMFPLIFLTITYSMSSIIYLLCDIMSVWNWTANGPIVHPRNDICACLCRSGGGLGQKPVPVPLCRPQIPQGLTCVRTRRLTARAVVGNFLPLNAFLYLNFFPCTFIPLVVQFCKSQQSS